MVGTAAGAPRVECGSRFRAFTAHETRWRLIFSFAARASTRNLASGVLKESIFRIDLGDDWGRIERNEDKILGRKDKRGE